MWNRNTNRYDSRFNEGDVRSTRFSGHVGLKMLLDLGCAAGSPAGDQLTVKSETIFRSR